MAQMVIALRRDPVTGKQNIVVKLDSDADALPMEHENLHRKLVEQLLGQGLSAEAVGELIVERAPIASSHDSESAPPAPAPQLRTGAS